jgi:hypothetical protein
MAFGTKKTIKPKTPQKHHKNTTKTPQKHHKNITKNITKTSQKKTPKTPKKVISTRTPGSALDLISNDGDSDPMRATT